MIEGLEKLLAWGGTRRDIAFLAVSGVALVLSLAGVEPFPFSIAWMAIILCGAHRERLHRRGLRCGRGRLHHAARRAARGAHRGARPRRHRTARPSDAAHGTAHRPRNGRGRGAAPRGGGDHRGGSRSGGRHPTRAARGGRARRRRHRLRSDLGEPGGHDRREPAGGQGPGGRGVVRHGQPVRLVRHGRDARGRGLVHPADDSPRAVGRRRQGQDPRPRS